MWTSGTQRVSRKSEILENPHFSASQLSPSIYHSCSTDNDKSVRFSLEKDVYLSGNHHRGCQDNMFLLSVCSRYVEEKESHTERTLRTYQDLPYVDNQGLLLFILVLKHISGLVDSPRRNMSRLVRVSETHHS